MTTAYVDGSAATWKVKHPKLFSLSRNGALSHASSKESNQTSTSHISDNGIPKKVEDSITIHVSCIDGNDSDDGFTAGSPIKTINHAFDIIKSIGYNETATIHLHSGFYLFRDEVVSFNTGNLGKQRSPVIIEGSKLEKQRDLYFTPSIDTSDKGDITGLWTLKYASEIFEVYPGDVIYNQPDNQHMQVVYAETNGVHTTIRVSYNGELTPQRFLGTVFRHTNNTTNLCINGTVEFIGKSDRICFKDIRFILDEYSCLKHCNLSLWMNNLYYVVKKGKNASVVFDTCRKVVYGERLAREFKMSNVMASEILGAVFETTSSNLDILLSNSVLLGENMGILDASIVLRDASNMIIKNSYLISTTSKSILYVCDISNYAFSNTRLMNVQSEPVVFEDTSDYNRCAVFRG